MHLAGKQRAQPRPCRRQHLVADALAVFGVQFGKPVQVDQQQRGGREAAQPRGQAVDEALPAGQVGQAVTPVRLEAMQLRLPAKDRATLVANTGRSRSRQPESGNHKRGQGPAEVPARVVRADLAKQTKG